MTLFLQDLPIETEIHLPIEPEVPISNSTNEIPPNDNNHITPSPPTPPPPPSRH